MWIARDYEGLIDLYTECPKREEYHWYAENNERYPLPSSLYPNLKWEDEPIEVSIIPNHLFQKTNKQVLKFAKNDSIDYWDSWHRNEDNERYVVWLDTWRLGYTYLMNKLAKYSLLNFN